MNNFTIALFLLTLATGAIWLLEMAVMGPRRAAAAPASPRHIPKQPLWIEYTAGLFPALILVFCVRSFLVEQYTIPSGSMTPTLLVGDFVVVNKFSYGIRLPILNRKIIQIGNPQAGDVMVFRHPANPAEDLIKRVVGVPGDRIEYRNKRLTINGKPLHYEQQRDYLGDEDLTLSRQYLEVLNGRPHAVLERDDRPELQSAPDNFPGRSACEYDDTGFACTVPQGQYFMMGDNRDNSSDSRYWGFVPDQNIVGKALFVWMNFHQLGHIGAIR